MEDVTNPGVGKPAGGACEPQDVVDLAQLEEQTEGDAELLREIVEMYADSREGTLGEIRVGIDRGDPDAVQRAAHRLKGSLKALAANPAAEVATELELLGRAGQLDGADDVFEALRRETERVEATLQALVAGRAP